MVAIDHFALFASATKDRNLPISWHWPLPPEAHITTWCQYVAESQQRGAWLTIQDRLVQLQFPVEQGISQTRLYRAVTQKGLQRPGGLTATGLVLQQPQALKVFIHESVAGPIPVLKTGNHADFAALVQAILWQNEPVPVPLSTGAYMVAGYNNWDRIHAYQAQWAAENPDNCSDVAWQAEFKRLVPQKELYHDRFIILHDGPYSSVSAQEMGLAEAEWRALSVIIRLEHECTHYFTKRVLGVMRRHVFDELLADYAGIVAAWGGFRADWFLRFMGLEAYPVYREGGRLQNYLDGIPPQSAAFQEVQNYLKRAAGNLERFDRQFADAHRSFSQQALVLLAICRHTLPELAAETAPEKLWQTVSLLEKQNVYQSQAGG